VKKKAAIFNDTRPAKHFGCDQVMRNLIDMVEQCGIEPIKFYPVGYDWESDNKLTTDLKEVDLVIVNGEGSIHHANQRAQSLARLGPFIRSLRKPSILLNSTFYANTQSVYSDILKYDVIYGRDFYSQKEIERFGGTAFYAPDLTFFNEVRAHSSQKSNNQKSNVLVGDDVVAETSKHLYELAKKFNLCRHNIHYHGIERPSLEFHLQEIFNASLIVTGRFHTVCFCINAGIPFVALESNTNKIENLLLDCFHSTDRMVTCDGLEKIELNDYLAWSNFEQEAILKFKKQGSNKFNKLMHDIKTLSLLAS
jgi:polysaccharide pyruvyl transferase WcaK-like protein